MSYLNLKTLEYPLNLDQIRNTLPAGTSVVANWTPSSDEYTWVFPTPMSQYDPITHGLREVNPIQTTKGHFEQQWEVFELTPEQVKENQEKKANLDQILIKDKIDKLWKAADEYTSSFISGVAIGLLTIGVLQQNPKALAITSWSSSIWDEYYARKSQVTVTSNLDLDFSSFGPMPYTVPELREELGL